MPSPPRAIAHSHKLPVKTAGWLLKDLQAPSGGFYGTLDADSEGSEGKFYLWDPEAVREILTPEEFALVSTRFGLTGPANFEGEAWHLYQAAELPEVAAAARLDEPNAQAALDEARVKLLAHREQRVWPGLDEKILTSWNGLLIRGLAIAARRLDQPAVSGCR